MNITSVLEKQKIFWLLIVGAALMIYGVYFFLELQSIEKANGAVQLKRIFLLVYNYGGKFTLLAIFELVGLITLFAGIKEFKTK